MKTCSKCRVEKSFDCFSPRKDAKDGLRGMCKSCQAANARAYRNENLEDIRSYDAAYRKARRHTDERFRQKSREYSRTWRQNNKAYNQERQRRYRQKNRQRLAYHAAKRRALTKDADGTFSLTEWLELCERYGNICLWCREAKQLTIDHVVPLSKGGTNYLNNIQPLCGRCNSAKGNRFMDFR